MDLLWGLGVALITTLPVAALRPALGIPVQLTMVGLFETRHVWLDLLVSMNSFFAGLALLSMLLLFAAIDELSWHDYAREVEGALRFLRSWISERSLLMEATGTFQSSRLDAAIVICAMILAAFAVDALWRIDGAVERLVAKNLPLSVAAIRHYAEGIEPPSDWARAPLALFAFAICVDCAKSLARRAPSP